MSQKESYHVNLRRRSMALLCACSLGLGLIVLTMLCAARPTLVQAGPVEGAASALAGATARAVSQPQAVDLQVSKQGPGDVYVTQRVSYTINITNNTGAAINGIVITDTWVANNQGEPADPEQQPTFDGFYETTPPGLVSAFENYSASLYARWELNSLGAGEQGAIRFWLDVPADLQPLKALSSWYDIGPSSVGNSVAVTGTGVTVNEPDQVVTAVQGPVFQMRQSSLTEPGVGLRAGHLLTYVLQLENLERADAIPATGIVIGESLPDDLLFEGATAENDPGASIEFDPVNRNITWTLSSVLDVGEILSVTFTVRLPVDQERGVNISNNKEDCWAISNELGQPVYCWANLKLKTLGILDKTYVTEPSNLPADESYQDRYITYTVYAFNPLTDTALSNLYITDVMPSTWRFISMVGDDAPQPINTGEITNTMTWHWPGPGVAISAYGVLTFSFVAHIGPYTRVEYGTSSCTKNYYNDMAAVADELPMLYAYGRSFGSNKDGLAELGVTEQVKIIKSVDSGLGGFNKTKQYPGELVTYTVNLDNLTDRTITNIVFTDTLPTKFFTFVGMIEGPEPVSVVTTTIVWSLGSLDPGAVSDALIFQVRVDGLWGLLYKNGVSGISDQSMFCSGWKAGLTLLTPIEYEKTADPALGGSGDWAVQEEWFDYTVMYDNRSNLRYAVVDFQDLLPAGFETGGSSTYEVLPPAAGLTATLLPDHQNNWMHTFSTTIVGAGWGTGWCEDLMIDEDGSNPNRNREIYQQAGSFVAHVSPLDYEGETKPVYNGQKTGPVLVKPHVDLRQIVYPKKGGLNGTVLVTLTLVNNTRNYHDATVQAINDIDLTYTLPSGFSLVEIIPPTQAPSEQTGTMLAWQGLDLPAVEGAQHNFYLRLWAPFEEDAPRGYAEAKPGDTYFCIPSSYARYYVVKGVEVKKEPEQPSTGPFGIVQYNMRLYNRTTAPVTGLVITDTLPAGFEFVSVLPGNPAPYSTKPLVWRDLEIAPSSDLEISYKARASGLFGVYYNEVAGVSDSTYVTYTNRYYEDVIVGVLPGVALYKFANTGQAQAGNTVVYTLTVDNRSEIDITNITVTDTLPANFHYQGMLSGDEPITTPTGLVWTVNNLDYLNKVEFVFSALIDDEIFDGTYCNQARATAFEAANPSEEVFIPDTDLTACIEVAGMPVIERSKTVSPATVQVGELTTYTITLHNGTGEPQTLRVTDTLPLSLTYVAVDAATPAPVQTSPVVWQGLAMDPDETLTLTLMAQVHASASPGVYYNQLDLATDEFIFPTATGLAPLQVVSRYDLQVSNSDGAPGAREGATLHYTIVYTNVNDAGLTLNNVVITDTFAPSLYAAPVDVSGDWSEVTSNTFTHVVGDLAPGESGSVQFSLQLSSTIPTSTNAIINQVSIGDDTPLSAEINPYNNQATDQNAIYFIVLSIAGGNNQSIVINTDSAEPLQVQVSDSAGEALGAGESVSFTAPLNGASLDPAAFSATTDASGLVSVTVQANAIVGSYQVVASRGNAAVLFDLSNVVTIPVPTYTLRIATTGDGAGSVRVDPDQASYEAGTLVTLTAVFSPGVYFGGWTGDLLGAANPETLVMDSDKAVTATFSSEPPVTYTLAVNTVGNGAVEPGGGTFVSGTLVALTATPDPGWYFERWSGDLQGAEPQASLLMDGDKAVTATFSSEPPVTYTLAVNTVGNGAVEPQGGTFVSGTLVSLAATPDPGWYFLHWSGDLQGNDPQPSLLMDSNKAVTATFSSAPPVTYTLTLIISPPSSGDVTLNPPGGVYAEHTLVQLTAIPAAGYMFAGFACQAGACQGLGTANLETVVMLGDMTVRASFQEAASTVYLPLLLSSYD